MTKSELNGQINTICEAIFADADLRGLREVSEAVRSRYRDKSARGRDLEIREDDQARAYLAWRFPVTAMVIHEVMRRLAEADPAFSPRRVLDLGAGPAVSVAPVTAVFPSVAEYILMEEQEAMAGAGRRMLRALAGLVPEGLDLKELRGDFLRTPLPGADLILASYAVNELDGSETRRFCETLGAAAGDATIVLIVPGTPEHFQQLTAIRNQFLAMGCSILAPCTFTGACPMEGEADWCHFYERVARSSLLRQLKAGQLAYEDEKFSYLILRRNGARATRDHLARIIRHPRISKGYREVTLCHRRGITMVRFSKGRHPDIYRSLKRKGWGDLLEVPLQTME